MAAILRFPEPSIDLDRVRLDSDEPCLVLILPVVRIERWDGPTSPERRARRRQKGREPGA